MTYIRCVSCGTLDFDGRFDYHFKQSLCCKFVLVQEEHPVHSRQTIFARRGNRSIVLMDSDGTHLWWKDIGLTR